MEGEDKDDQLCDDGIDRHQGVRLLELSHRCVHLVIRVHLSLKKRRNILSKMQVSQVRNFIFLPSVFCIWFVFLMLIRFFNLFFCRYVYLFF